MEKKRNNLQVEVKCNLCGSDSYIIKYDNQADLDYDVSNIFSATGGLRNVNRIVTCSKCGLIYANPQFRPELMVDAYANVSESLYMNQKDARTKTFIKGVKLLEKYINKGKILDIGCGAGFFLESAKKRGWEVYGVEPNKDMVNYAKTELELNVQQGTLQNIDFPDQYFDVITIWDALEHVADPMGELKRISRILKKGGILLINYPDIGSKLAKLAGKYWWFLLSSHMYYFTVKTITAMLEKTDFNVVKKKRHIQLLSLQYLLGMLKIYNLPIPKFLTSKPIRLFGKEILIPYYASQTNIIARKN